MLQIAARTWGLTLVVGVLGALLGFGIELVTGQPGWVLVGGSMGLCGGAIFAGSLMNPQPPAEPERGAPPPPQEPAPSGAAE
jgi:hypothetical protein